MQILIKDNMKIKIYICNTNNSIINKMEQLKTCYVLCQYMVLWNNIKTGSTSARCQNFSQKCVNDAIKRDVADAENS